MYTYYVENTRPADSRAFCVALPLARRGDDAGRCVLLLQPHTHIVYDSSVRSSIRVLYDRRAAVDARRDRRRISETRLYVPMTMTYERLAL